MPCPLAQRFYKIYNVTRLRPDGVIGMHLGASDDASGVDQKPRGHRQFPSVIAVESFEVDTETAIQFLEFFWQGEVQAKFFSIAVIYIRQYRKGELMLFHDLFCVFVQLGTNCDDRASQFLHLAMDFLQSFQLRIAIGSPDTAIENNGERPLSQKIF